MGSRLRRASESALIQSRVNLNCVPFTLQSGKAASEELFEESETTLRTCFDNRERPPVELFFNPKRPLEKLFENTKRPLASVSEELFDDTERPLRDSFCLEEFGDPETHLKELFDNP